MSEFKVVEKFVSINGEGVRSGQPAVFIRFAGCNLNCTYCDTQWANAPDAPYKIETEETIYQFIESTGIHNITLTGGEPLLQPNIEDLIAILLRDEQLRIEIETNGSINLDFLMPIKIKFQERLVFTVDYKLPKSGMEEKMITSHFVLLDKEDTVKFVASDIEDLNRAKEIIDKYNLTGKCNVYISPVFGRMNLQEMVQFLIDHKMNKVTMQIQMHKIIWDPNQRGV